MPDNPRREIKRVFSSASEKVRIGSELIIYYSTKHLNNIVFVSLVHFALKFCRFKLENLENPRPPTELHTRQDNN